MFFWLYLSFLAGVLFGIYLVAFLRIAAEADRHSPPAGAGRTRRPEADRVRH